MKQQLLRDVLRGLERQWLAGEAMAGMGLPALGNFGRIGRSAAELWLR